ncbi:MULTISPECIES: pirin family protein [unclassified Roseitalea]|uniref:pirin family protein n=1 Tax=unclassified Roseitalea TaxID=2639107 RepID=UPI00273E5300|nr:MULTISPECIES: pirin family protein [unclassified Roseitalea]
MSFFPGPDPQAGDAFACDAIEALIVPNAKDIGGFEVRRALPSRQRKLVGPFIFFDRMGPAVFRPGQAIDVRPHPHIGLSTVTYLFDGTIRHRDSLGTEMVIAPGDINLMTAGRGIVHSERSPEELRSSRRRMSGLQTWLALPDGMEEMAPAFENTPADTMGLIDGGKARARVLIGAFHGVRSQVTQYAETLYVDVTLDAGGEIDIPADTEERAIYVIDGTIELAGDSFAADQLLVLKPGDRIVVRSPGGGAFMVFGGASIGSPRHIWWNFVSSSKERIEQAKQEWRSGRFDIVPGDEEEFIPLP